MVSTFPFMDTRSSSFIRVSGVDCKQCNHYEIPCGELSGPYQEINMS